MAGLGMLLYAIIEAPKHRLGRLCHPHQVLHLAYISGTPYFLGVTHRPSDARSAHSTLTRVLRCGDIDRAHFPSYLWSSLYPHSISPGRSGAFPAKRRPSLDTVAVAVGVSSPLSILVERRIGTKLTVAIGLLITACGLAIMTRITRDQGYTLVFGGLVLAGTGMGLAMTPPPPMRSLARCRKSRRVLVRLSTTRRYHRYGARRRRLGSLLATSYVNHLTPELGRFPPAIASSAQASVGVAVATAGTISEPDRQELIIAAREAFTTAAAHTFLIASLIAAGGAIVAAAFLPRNPRIGHGGESEEQTIVLAGVERVSVVRGLLVRCGRRPPNGSANGDWQGASGLARAPVNWLIEAGVVPAEKRGRWDGLRARSTPCSPPRHKRGPLGKSLGNSRSRPQSLITSSRCGRWTFGDAVGGTRTPDTRILIGPEGCCLVSLGRPDWLYC